MSVTKSWLFRAAFLALALFVVISFVKLRLQYNESKQRLDDLNAQLDAQMNSKLMLEDQLSSYEEYLEQQARKQGLAKPGETILVEIPSE